MSTAVNTVKKKSQGWRCNRCLVARKVISSQACIAGHKAGDEFLIDPLGRVQPPADGQGICLMALHKIWWRVLLVLERMAAAGDTAEDFRSSIFDLAMNCYGAGLPLGACGEILMKVEVREPAKR